LARPRLLRRTIFACFILCPIRRINRISRTLRLDFPILSPQLLIFGTDIRIFPDMVNWEHDYGMVFVYYSSDKYVNRFRSVSRAADLSVSRRDRDLRPDAAERQASGPEISEVELRIFKTPSSMAASKRREVRAFSLFLWSKNRKRIIPVWFSFPSRGEDFVMLFCYRFR